MKEIVPFGYYVMTREQNDEAAEATEADEKFRPLRWLYRSGTTRAAVHMMRHFAQWFNNLLVWDVRQNKVGAMLSNSYPLQYDPVAPEIIEEYVTIRERPEGVFTTIGRRHYDYPHPSGNYTRTDSVHSKG